MRYIPWMILVVFLSLSPALAETEIYEIDPVHSFACFKVGHMGIGFVRGRFADISGTIKGDRLEPEKGSMEVVIKTGSIDTGVKKRDEHLKSPDFFDTEKYPTMSFRSTKIKELARDVYEVTGDFTLLGVTKSIKVRVTFTGEGKDPTGAYRAGGETQFSIRRSEYGMNKLIPGAGDQVNIQLNFEGIRK